MDCVFPTQSPIAGSVTIYACPTTGPDGGPTRSSSTVPETRTSKVCKLSLTKVIGIFAHPVDGPVVPRHHFLGAVERPVEQHQLEPRVSAAQGLVPRRPKLGVHLAPAIDHRHRNAGLPARFADVAGIRQHAEEPVRLVLRPVPRRLLLPLRLARGDQRQFLRFASLPSPRTPNEIGPHHLKDGRPVWPRWARFFTVPTLYPNSVTMSRVISPIWLVGNARLVQRLCQLSTHCRH